MISIRSAIAYPKSSAPVIVEEVFTPEQEDTVRICPHCGATIDHNPDDTFNFAAHTIIVRSKRMPGLIWERRLGPKSWHVLMFLLDRIGKFMSTERVMMACFDEEVDNGIVTVQVGEIRKALSGSNYYIETRYKSGYRLLRKPGDSNN